MPRFLEEDTAEEEAITLGRQKCIPPGDCGGHCAATDDRISDLAEQEPGGGRHLCLGTVGAPQPEVPTFTSQLSGWLSLTIPVP